MDARFVALEERLVDAELGNNKALRARVKRLEADVVAYREARDMAVFKLVDLRAALDHSASQIASLRASPAHRLGSLLIASGSDWRKLVGLPVSLVAWARDSRRHREEIEARIVPDGNAAEYNTAVERAVEVANRRGLEQAGRWAVDQRLRAPVLARVLVELANLARKSDVDLAVRLARDAIEADPGENRVKRLAFLMSEAGSVTMAADLLRSAISKGAVFNAAEEMRAEELFALAEFPTAGLALLRTRKSVGPPAPANRRALIFAAQSYPFHWTSAAIRTHALALSLTRADTIVAVVTPPGYPDLGSRERQKRPAIRHVDGVDYHLLTHANAHPGLDQDYVKQAAAMLVSAIRRLGATMLVAPLAAVHAYPAAIAAQITGVSLVLDCWSATRVAEDCRTERGRIMAHVEDQLIGIANLMLVRTPAIAARIRHVSPDARLCLVPDFTPAASSDDAPQDRKNVGPFVFGYVGDNAPDVDLEALACLLQSLVADGVDAHLVVRAVGSRVKALGNRLELAGLGHRVEIVEKSPPGRQVDLAYREIDVVVAPVLSTEDALSSPFQIVSAVRHGKCVVAMGENRHEDLFGTAVLYAGDPASAVRILAELSRSPDLRQRQEAQARSWHRSHLPDQALLDAVNSL